MSADGSQVALVCVCVSIKVSMRSDSGWIGWTGSIDPIGSGPFNSDAIELMPYRFLIDCRWIAIGRSVTTDSFSYIEIKEFKITVVGVGVFGFVLFYRWKQAQEMSQSLAEEEVEEEGWEEEHCEMTK